MFTDAELNAIQNAAQAVFEMHLNRRGKCDLNSYETGTFKCDPSMSDTTDTPQSDGREKKTLTDTDKTSRKSDLPVVSGKVAGGKFSVAHEANKQLSAIGIHKLPFQSIGSIKEAVTWMKRNGVKAISESDSPSKRIIDLIDNNDSFKQLDIFSRIRIGAELERKDRGSDYTMSPVKVGAFGNQKTRELLDMGNDLKQSAKKDDIEEVSAGKRKVTLNIKLAAEGDEHIVRLLPGDTVRGCDQYCYACYANKGTQQSKTRHQAPTHCEISGEMNTNDMLRIGSVGEPAKDWAYTHKQVSSLIDRSNKKIDAYNARIDKANAAVERYNKAHPESPKPYDSRMKQERVSAERNVFYISKLLNIEDFNPDTVKNIEISMDPLYPDHMRQTMINVLRVKDMYPDTNIALRIRSVDSYDKGLQATMAAAIDFANITKLPVLETKLRFEKQDVSTRLLDLTDEYKKKGNQIKLVGSAVKDKITKDKYFICNELGVTAGACSKCRNCYKTMINTDTKVDSRTRTKNIKDSTDAIRKLKERGLDLSKLPSMYDPAGGRAYEAGEVYDPAKYRQRQKVEKKKKE